MCDSQEAWWLRKGCQRSRCRLIKRLADAFDIPVRSVQVRSSLNFQARVHLSLLTISCLGASKKQRMECHMLQPCSISGRGSGDSRGSSRGGMKTGVTGPYGMS